MFAILIALAQSSPSQAPIPMPRIAYSALSGPRHVCTEFFTVELEAGETLAWTPASNFTGGISHLLVAGGKILQIGLWQGEAPPEPGSPITLPLSSISERAAVETQGMLPDGRLVPAYRVRYFLHGGSRSETPLTASFITPEATDNMAVISRITPGSMEQRHCPMASRLDPDVRSEITSFHPY